MMTEKEHALFMIGFKDEGAQSRAREQLREYRKMHPEETKRAEVYILDSSNTDAHLYVGGQNDGNYVAIYFCDDVAHAVLKGYGDFIGVRKEVPLGVKFLEF